MHSEACHEKADCRLHRPHHFVSAVASLGVLSHGHYRYRPFTIARGELVEVQDAGIYRNSLRTPVTGGIPWDFVRLIVCIPLLLVSFVLYLRGSLRGTVLYIGSLASFLYQYPLRTFDWAYNSLFLVYVAILALSLWTLIFVLATVEDAQVREAIGERFPVKTAATFSFALACSFSSVPARSCPASAPVRCPLP